MSPKAPAVHGSENIRKGSAEGFATPGPGLSWRTTAVEVARSGDLAYENGTYDFVTTGKDGKTSDEKGKYLVIWKKQADGAWKVVVDMDNTDEERAEPVPRARACRCKLCGAFRGQRA